MSGAAMEARAQAAGRGGGSAKRGEESAKRGEESAARGEESAARGEESAAALSEMGAAARGAARILAQSSTAAKDAALRGAAQAVRAGRERILQANRADMAAARDLSAARRDRLALDAARVEAMAGSLEAIAALEDPVGKEIARWRRPNGLEISRVRTPLGVIGIIYESRPNVTADAGSLCLKAGNACILRAGSESAHSARAIHQSLAEGVAGSGLPAAAIQLAPLGDRSVVGAMLSGLDGAIDVIVPRGGAGLVGRVQSEARVPVFGHLEGRCHVYVDGRADLAMARAVVLNAKMRRTGICGAAETLLVDQACAASHLGGLVKALLDAGCAVRGDGAAQGCDSRVEPARAADWDTEYLDAIISVKCVDGVEGAVAHIARHGSGHTEAIITGDAGRAQYFFRHLDSAILLHNASTQYADGGEFGMGAEIGIATGKLHARGPVGVEQLTSFKYIVRGQGQCRP